MTAPLPPFEILRPASLDEALRALAANPGARLLAGGTDLLVNLRRGIGSPGLLIDLGNVEGFDDISATEDGGLRIGAGVRLARLEREARLRAGYLSVARAAGSVAAPTHREVATLGGNLCLDTRCLYYNQSEWWRRSNGWCLKLRGDICHVAPQGNRCRAAFSGDLAPALMVHGARIELAGPDGARRLPLADFYHEDGAAHLRLQAGEMVVAVHLPPPAGASDYEKIRVRGAIDFPLAGVAVASAREGGATRLRVAVTGTNSCPVAVELPALPAGAEAGPFLKDLGKRVQRAVSPQRSTTIAPHYRRLAAAAVAERLARRLLAQQGQGEA